MHVTRACHVNLVPPRDQASSSNQQGRLAPGHSDLSSSTAATHWQLPEVTTPGNRTGPDCLAGQGSSTWIPPCQSLRPGHRRMSPSAVYSVHTPGFNLPSAQTKGTQVWLSRQPPHTARTAPNKGASIARPASQAEAFPPLAMSSHGPQSHVAIGSLAQGLHCEKKQASPAMQRLAYRVLPLDELSAGRTNKLPLTAHFTQRSPTPWPYDGHFGVYLWHRLSANLPTSPSPQQGWAA